MNSPEIKKPDEDALGDRPPPWRVVEMAVSGRIGCLLAG